MNSLHAVLNWVECHTRGVYVVVPFVFVLYFSAQVSSELFDQEGRVRIPHFLSEKPLCLKIFDSRVVEYGMYQGRELSYVFDYLDVLCIDWSVRQKFPVFLSVTHYISWSVSLYLLWVVLTQYIQAGRITSLLLLLILCTSPFFYATGYYYRTAKILVVLFSSCSLYLIYARPNHLWRPLLLFVLFACSICDRQGFFYVCALPVFLLLANPNGLPTADKRSALFISIMVAALNCLYNLWAAPAITDYLLGYRPDFTYQQQGIPTFLESPYIMSSMGVSLFIGAVVRLLGGMSSGQVTMLLVGLLGVFTAFSLRKQIRVLVVGSLLIAAMDAFMASGGPGVWAPDYRGCYYWMAQSVFVILWLASLIRSIPLSTSWKPLVSYAILLFILLGNADRMPEWERDMRGGIRAIDYERTPYIIAAIRWQDDPTYRPLPEQQKDSICQFFKKRYVK